MLYDKDIREPLFDFLEETYGKIRIIEEKQVGKSRADIVMVLPGLLTGIEIKSDADTYVRLSRQVKDYDRFFDRNMVVAGSSHAVHVREHVPEWWGIITVEQTDLGIDFYVLREPRENPQMNWKRKLSLLSVSYTHLCKQGVKSSNLSISIRDCPNRTVPIRTLKTAY